MRTEKCTSATVAGRLDKANQFLLAAETIAEEVGEPDIGDAFVTLCVHAGIAAADVLCCKALGEHALGGDHEDAKKLLRKFDKQAEKRLETLLTLKTRAAYTHEKISGTDRKRAERAARDLVDRARSA